MKKGLLKRDIRWIAVLGSCLLLAEGASAQFNDGFETYNGSPAGQILTGQGGWYNPVGGSNDYRVYTYAGNALGAPANPNGGTQFAAGTSLGGTGFARAQHDLTYGSGLWCICYWILVQVVGPGPFVDNVGSFSQQPAPNDYIQLNTWVPGEEGTLWRVGYLAYDKFNTQFPAPGAIPGPEWENIPRKVWIYVCTYCDFDLNRITLVTIQPLGGPETSYVPDPPWYLEGGPGGSSAPATAVRMFAGGDSPGNVMAFDEIAINPMNTTPVAPTTWGRIKATFSETTRRVAPRPVSYPTHWPAVD